MPFGYIGQNQPKQKVKNAGVISSFEISHLEQLNQTGRTLELIETVTLSSYSETVNFTSINESHYNIHYLTITNLQGNSSTAQDVGFRLSTDGGSNWISSGYKHALQDVSEAGNVSEVNDTSANRMFFSMDLDDETNARVNGHAYFYNLGSSDRYSMSASRCSITQTSHKGRKRDGGSVLPTAAAHNAIQVMSSSNGGFQKGTFHLYGVRE